MPEPFPGHSGSPRVSLPLGVQDTRLLLCCWAQSAPTLPCNLRNAVWPWNSPVWNPPVMSHHLQDYVRNRAHDETFHILAAVFSLPLSPPLSYVSGMVWGTGRKKLLAHPWLMSCSLTFLYLGTWSSFSLKCPPQFRSPTLILLIRSPSPPRSFCYSRDSPGFSPPLLPHCTWSVLLFQHLSPYLQTSVYIFHPYQIMPLCLAWCLTNRQRITCWIMLWVCPFYSTLLFVKCSHI